MPQLHCKFQLNKDAKEAAEIHLRAGMAGGTGQPSPAMFKVKPNDRFVICFVQFHQNGQLEYYKVWSLQNWAVKPAH